MSMHPTRVKMVLLRGVGVRLFFLCSEDFSFSFFIESLFWFVFCCLGGLWVFFSVLFLVENCSR